MMALQKERGVNPLAGCLPILPQIPVFLSLFHVLRRLAPGAEGLYGWSDELTDEAARAKLFGAPISASFNMTGAKEAAILAIAGALHQHPHRRVRADRDHVLHDLLHAEADHDALRPGRGSGRDGAEAPALRHAAEPLRLRLLLPDRRPPVLVHQQPLDPGPAVLHPAQAAAARVGRRTRPRPPPTSRSSTRKTLAPKPGAKPVRTKPGRPADRRRPRPTADAATDAAAPPTAPAPTGTAAERPTAGRRASGRAARPGPASRPPNRGKRKRR